MKILKRKTLKQKQAREIADKKRLIYALEHQNSFIKKEYERLENEIQFYKLSLSLVAEIAINSRGNNGGQAIVLSKEELEKAIKTSKNLVVDFDEEKEEYSISLREGEVIACRKKA
ncbi:MAG: hypothetical protein GX896_09035 [Clostridiales bacterium]|mgnify:CR=1 FL=1|nr:hypothetical protein [Clostridiales bacterium]